MQYKYKNQKLFFLPLLVLKPQYSVIYEGSSPIKVKKKI